MSLVRVGRGRNIKNVVGRDIQKRDRVIDPVSYLRMAGSRTSTVYAFSGFESASG